MDLIRDFICKGFAVGFNKKYYPILKFSNAKSSMYGHKYLVIRTSSGNGEEYSDHYMLVNLSWHSIWNSEPKPLKDLDLTNFVILGKWYPDLVITPQEDEEYQKRWDFPTPEER